MQPKTLIEAVQTFADLDVCHAYMVKLKWPDGRIVCPKCGGDRVGKVASRRMLQCKEKACRKQFSAKVGTLMEDSPLGLDKWFVAVWAVANGCDSSVQLAKAVRVTQKSAWLILHRIKLAMQTEEFAIAEPNVEYRPVRRFPGYRVGTNGSVWTRWHGNAGLGSVWKMLHPTRNGHGYRCVDLRDGSGHRRMCQVSVLVLEAFVGERPDGQEARHLDGKQTNDRLGNLAWGTSLENAADRKRHGTTARGQRHHLAVLTDAQVAEVRRLAGKVSRAELAERFCVPVRYIHRICRGETRCAAVS